MKVIIWNLNGRSTVIAEGAVALISNSLKNENPGLIILTEYVPTPGLIDKLSDVYDICVNKEIENNGIIIGVRKGMFNIEQNDASEFLDESDSNPNFLCVPIKSDGKILFTIIGCRVKTGESDDKDFQNRKLQVINLLKKVEKINSPIILGGDFNNGWFSEKDLFEKNISELYADKPRQYYNYLLLKSLMERHGFKVNTPQGRSWKNFRLDHIFTTDTVNVGEISYNWNFQNTPNSQEQIGFPDHALLIANLNL